MEADRKSSALGMWKSNKIKSTVLLMHNSNQAHPYHEGTWIMYHLVPQFLKGGVLLKGIWDVVGHRCPLPQVLDSILTSAAQQTGPPGMRTHLDKSTLQPNLEHCVLYTLQVTPHQKRITWNRKWCSRQQPKWSKSQHTVATRKDGRLWSFFA